MGHLTLSREEGGKLVSIDGDRVNVVPMISSSLKITGGLILLSGFAGATPSGPMMIEPAEPVVTWDFDGAGQADHSSLKLRKETVVRVEDGALRAVPPVLLPKVDGSPTKWGDSNFARAGLVGLPQDYVCTARWKYIDPADANTRTKVLVYIDFGHRMIRVTIDQAGATLLLENHLIGRHDNKPAIVRDKAPKLTLEPDHWYDIVAEVKGTEVIIQIDNHVLYGKHDLIANERYDTFNFDAIGDGYLLDRIAVYAAGEFKSDWPAKRRKL